MGSPCIHPGIIVALSVLSFLLFCAGTYHVADRRGLTAAGGYTGVGLAMKWGFIAIGVGIMAALLVGLPLGLAC